VVVEKDTYMLRRIANIVISFLSMDECRQFSLARDCKDHPSKYIFIVFVFLLAIAAFFVSFFAAKE